MSEYNYGPTEHELAGGFDESRSEFDQIFEDLEAPEYPATCDECGTVGTNASMAGHECGAVCKPQGVILKRNEIGWQAERLPIHGCRIVDNTGRLIAADVYDEDIAEQIVAEHNQHAALVEQRDCALTVLKGVAIMLNTNLSSYDDEPWARRVRAAISTIEQPAPTQPSRASEQSD